MILDLTPDEFALLSGSSLYGLHCAGATHAGIIRNLHKYTERVRRTLEPDSAAAGVAKALALKMRDAANTLETNKPEVFTA